MVETGDWVTPHMDGVVYLDNPPAYFWAVAVSYLVFGVSEWSARAPSALFALAGIVLVGWFVRKRMGSVTAWLAGLTLALSPLYIVFGRIVIFDMMMTFCMTVASLAAFEALESESRRRLPGMLFFAAGGIGTISKGPVAFILPLLVAVAWTLVRRRPRALGRLGFGTGALVYFAVIVPWLVLVESRNPGYLRYAIVGENLQRMISNRFETARPFYFYLKVVLPGLFPWIVLCLIAAIRKAREVFTGRPFGEAWRAARERLAHETEPGRLLLGYATIWLGVILLFFSAIASKRPSYMVPCAVPLAILSAHLWSGAFERRREGAESRGPLEHGLFWLAILCAAGGLIALLAGTAGPALGISEGKYDTLLSRRLLFGGTAAGLPLAAALLFAMRRVRRPAPALPAAGPPLPGVAPPAPAPGAHPH